MVEHLGNNSHNFVAFMSMEMYFLNEVKFLLECKTY